MTREQIRYALNPKYKVKLLDKQTRLAYYRDIYVACRKLKMTHTNAQALLIQALQTSPPNPEPIYPDEINMYWPRCAVCNKMLKIDKRTGDDYCINKSCSNYMHPIRKPS